MGAVRIPLVVDESGVGLKRQSRKAPFLRRKHLNERGVLAFELAYLDVDYHACLAVVSPAYWKKCCHNCIDDISAIEMVGSVAVVAAGIAAVLGAEGVEVVVAVFAVKAGAENAVVMVSWPRMALLKH